MPQFFANTALLPEGWANDVLITADEGGWITDVKTGQKSGAAQILPGPVIPGMPNLHSHAFQRAMAGLAERATGDKDSFWTWREVMYDFLDQITPEDMEAIAAQLYMEMLKAGYTAVGEFHYVHHQPDGTPYDDPALLSRHVIAAAKKTGIGITHMPALYAHGGFGGQKPVSGQKRFINGSDAFLDIITALHRDYKDDPQVRIGLVHHSLRAVTPEMLNDVTAKVHDMDSDAPVHIHIAEQTKEVDDCIAWSGQRPVEWLLENAPVDERWCLIHATHMTDEETESLAKTGAVAGLCPTTEANLGDGLFNLPHYLASGGKLGIGSDSHISVSMIEELRTLEYGQRLLRRERAVVKTPGNPSVGSSLYKMALAGGAQAMGRPIGGLEVGKRADFIVLDPENPALFSKKDDLTLDAMVFAGNVNPVKDVFSGGVPVVKDFRHVRELEIFEKYKDTLAKLLAPKGDDALNERLRNAAAHDDTGAVKALLAEGANPYDTDEKGRTAFNRAASNGLEALDLLTREAFNDTQKPLGQRRWKEYELNTPSGSYQSTLITYAAKVSSVDLVREMIKAGADITIVNGSGWTLLHCAAVMPGRSAVLGELVTAFQKQGHGDLIDALSTHVYETEYNGHKVVFGRDLTAAGLCQARIDQDSKVPAELPDYMALLGPF